MKERLKKAIEEDVGIDYGRAKTYTVGSWLSVFFCYPDIWHSYRQRRFVSVQSADVKGVQLLLRSEKYFFSKSSGEFSCKSRDKNLA